MKQAHDGKECVSVAGVLKAVNFLRPGYHYEHDTVFKEMHRRAPPVTGVCVYISITGTEVSINGIYVNIP